jgi:hypothetical protein
MRCKKYKLDVTGCSKCTGSDPVVICQNCGFKAGISETHGKTKGEGKTIRKSMSGHIKNRGKVVKRVSTLMVRPYLKGEKSWIKE